MGAGLRLRPGSRPRGCRYRLAPSLAPAALREQPHRSGGRSAHRLPTRCRSSGKRRLAPRRPGVHSSRRSASPRELALRTRSGCRGPGDGLRPPPPAASRCHEDAPRSSTTSRHCSTSRSWRNRSRRYISSIRPPRSRMRSSRVRTSALRSRRSAPGAGTRPWGIAGAWGAACGAASAGRLRKRSSSDGPAIEAARVYTSGRPTGRRTQRSTTTTRSSLSSRTV